MVRWSVGLVLAFLSQLAVAALDLNTATKDELVALSGIGPAKAQAILDYRTQHGGFKSLDELKDVKGIGERQFEMLKSELTVGPAAAKASPRAPAARADAKSRPAAAGAQAAAGTEARAHPTAKGDARPSKQ